MTFFIVSISIWLIAGFFSARMILLDVSGYPQVAAWAMMLLGVVGWLINMGVAEGRDVRKRAHFLAWVPRLPFILYLKNKKTRPVTEILFMVKR